MKQTVLFLLLAIVGTFTASAQELSVKSFEVKTNDLSARTQSRQDNNGNDCALVKVQLAASGAKFEGNIVGDVKYDTSEYWVYMPQGSKRMTVKLEGYLPLEVSFNNYQTSKLEKATYFLVLKKEELNPLVQEKAQNTYNASTTNTLTSYSNVKIEIDVSKRKLNDADLRGKSKKELEILRNMIYARHGYRFRRNDLLQYFSQFSWYRPTTTDQTIAYNEMSDIERYNIDFIKKHEQ